ncbi:MAG: Rpn family recombination-promoting nuclease/putative transposase [Synergistaceae bacterium]|jgi:predicted transposase/invertase (TIGR01784 family)|nr:Rpn family recombination-promoting nuclease/putative transposase [Synergistaceae bacterium]
MIESVEDDYIGEAFSSELDELIPRTRDDAVERLKQGRLFRLLDSIIKFILARPENEAICRDFLNAVIFPDGSREFTLIEVLGSDTPPARLRGRGSRIDLRGVLDDDSMLNVEIQINYDAAHASRAVYYWSLVHTNQLESGDLYKETSRTVSINVLGFDMLKLEKNFCNSYSIRNDGSSRVLSDDLKIIFIELPKYIRELKKPGRKLKSKLERWLCFLVGLEDEHMPNMAEEAPLIGTAIEQEKLFIVDERLRMAYIDDLMDMYSERRREARAMKLEKDKLELVEENKKHLRNERRTAVKFAELGLTIEEIAVTMGVEDEDARNFLA